MHHETNLWARSRLDFHIATECRDSIMLSYCSHSMLALMMSITFSRQSLLYRWFHSDDLQYLCCCLYCSSETDSDFFSCLYSIEFSFRLTQIALDFLSFSLLHDHHEVSEDDIVDADCRWDDAITSLCMNKKQDRN